jgi:hypothetical protein
MFGVWIWPRIKPYLQKVALHIWQSQTGVQVETVKTQSAERISEFQFHKDRFQQIIAEMDSWVDRYEEANNDRMAKTEEIGRLKFEFERDKAQLRIENQEKINELQRQVDNLQLKAFHEEQLHRQLEDERRHAREMEHRLLVYENLEKELRKRNWMSPKLESEDAKSEPRDWKIEENP